MSRDEQPTPAEIRALKAYLDFGSMREAAYRLGCAESTVKNHIANMRARFEAKTTAELVLILARQLAA